MCSVVHEDDCGRGGHKLDGRDIGGLQSCFMVREVTMEGLQRMRRVMEVDQGWG